MSLRLFSLFQGSRNQQWGGPFYVLGLTNNSIFHSFSNLQRGNFVIREESTNDRDEYKFEPPPIELYTQFSLLTYLLVFLGLLFLQSLTIFLVDVKWNKTILQDTRIWDRILHAIQKMHFPFPYVKWYKGDGNCMDHLKRKKETEHCIGIEMHAQTIQSFVYYIIILLHINI